MRDLVDFIVGGLILGAVTLVIVFAVLVPSSYLDRKACFAQTQDMHRAARWSFWGGCRVSTDQGFIPLDNFRVVK